jgi:hypothetical protein
MRALAHHGRALTPNDALESAGPATVPRSSIAASLTKVLDDPQRLEFYVGVARGRELAQYGVGDGLGGFGGLAGGGGELVEEVD